VLELQNSLAHKSTQRTKRKMKIAARLQGKQTRKDQSKVGMETNKETAVQRLELKQTRKQQRKAQMEIYKKTPERGLNGKKQETSQAKAGMEWKQTRKRQSEGSNGKK
jgi:sRNA-binding carbon storage regulator CsrA